MELKAGFKEIRNSVERRTPPDAIRQSLLWELAQTSRSRLRRRIVGWSVAAVALLVCALALWPRQPVVQEEAALRIPVTDGFQAVPYASPLAEGEFVREVHTELTPGMLMRLGVYGASASSETIPVDLLVGQDNAPLAVRVDEDEDKETQ
jgi:hypothetical protein